MVLSVVYQDSDGLSLVHSRWGEIHTLGKYPSRSQSAKSISHWRSKFWTRRGGIVPRTRSSARSHSKMDDRELLSARLIWSILVSAAVKVSRQKWPLGSLAPIYAGKYGRKNLVDR